MVSSLGHARDWAAGKLVVLMSHPMRVCLVEKLVLGRAALAINHVAMRKTSSHSGSRFYSLFFSAQLMPSLFHRCPFVMGGDPTLC